MSVPLVMVAVRTGVPTPLAPTAALVILGTGWAMKVGGAMVNIETELCSTLIKLHTVACKIACALSSNVKLCSGYYANSSYCGCTVCEL